MKPRLLAAQRSCLRNLTYIFYISSIIWITVLIVGNRMTFSYNSNVDSSIETFTSSYIMDDSSIWPSSKNEMDDFEISTNQSYSMDSTIFKDISSSAGIKIYRPTYGDPIAGDFNNDKYIDFLVINHGRTPSLFHNNADGTFTNIQSKSGITSSGDRHGASWGDYDNDGDLDLFITIGADQGKEIGLKRDQLYRNEGNEIFVDVTDLVGVSNQFGRGRSVNWIDVNNDGHLDLFVKNHQSDNVLYLNHGNGNFSDIATAANLSKIQGDVSSWADYDNDSYMDLFVTSATRDQLWRNNGDRTFSEVTSRAGLRNNWYGQGVAWGDYNNDGYIDLYIARGYNDIEDGLIWNSSHITFSDLEGTEEDGLDFVTSGDEVVFDLFLSSCREPNNVFIASRKLSPTSVPFTLSIPDASGQPFYTPGQELGFFIWNDHNGWHIRWSSNGVMKYFYGKISSNGKFSTVKPLNFTRIVPFVSSTLYRNNGNGTFTDVTNAAGVGSHQNNRAAVWGDYDNDGYLDLYVVNSGSINGNKSNILYRNNGNDTFSIVTGDAKVWGSINGHGRGDGASWTDINNDGFLDLYVTNGWGRPVSLLQENQECLSSGPHLLFQNNGNKNRWIDMKLIGIVSNRDAVGAKITLQYRGQIQFREINGLGGGQFYSQGSGPLHFGVGSADSIEVIRIKWPSGIVQTLENIASNQSITIFEDQPIQP